jgi:hypothetical protein
MIERRRLGQGIPNEGAWATVGKQGEVYGVVITMGEEAFFIAECDLTEENLAKVSATSASNAKYAELVRHAWGDLERFKAKVKHREARHQNE